MAARSGAKDVTVEGFIASCAPPLQPVLEFIRETILRADSRITEGIKWNAVSFRTTEWFATTNVRSGSVRLILHLGAKARPEAQPAVADPAGLLCWLGKDRALLTFADLADAKAKAKPLKALVKAWVRFVGDPE